MNAWSRLAGSVIVVVSVGASWSALETAPAQAQVIAPKPPVATASQQLSCAGETSFRIEVERPRDVQVSMSRPAGAAGWNTILMATGRVATLDHARSCGSSPTRVQITVEEADARAALQTCAIMGASLSAGQKLVLSSRSTEGARAGAGGSLLVAKAVQIDCGVE
jgi:hypothetical protein